MKLSIDHQTNYYYKEFAQRSVQYIRMSPMALPHQIVHTWSVMLPKLATLQKDGFGNTWFTLSRNEKHDNLQIQASGIVEINTDTQYVEDSGEIPYLLFTVQTPLTYCSTSMRDFAVPYLETVTLENLRGLASALITKMPYTTNVTHVGTTAEESFEMKAGVCQDHTHVFLGCLRDKKIPARYVSGYLYDADQNHMSSHAWAEAYLDGYWYTFDISNQLFQPSHHVYVAIGRDYLDAAPVRGVRIGGGYESLYSQVMVNRID